MITPFELILCSLAVFRLSYMVTHEVGLFSMFKKFRSFVSRKAPKKTKLEEGIKCAYCSSIHISALLIIVASLRPVMASWLNLVCGGLLLVLAISGLSVLLHQAFTWIRRE